MVMEWPDCLWIPEPVSLGSHLRSATEAQPMPVDLQCQIIKLQKPWTPASLNVGCRVPTPDS